NRAHACLQAAVACLLGRVRTCICRVASDHPSARRGGIRRAWVGDAPLGKGRRRAMLQREKWTPLARKLDWTFSYVREEEVVPPEIGGRPWVRRDEWQDWDEPYRTSFSDYVVTQCEKDDAVDAVRKAFARTDGFAKLAAPWVNGVKLHSATLPLAEFAAVVG